MPRVLSYTPSWLCHPSPGYQLFHDSPRSRSKRANGTGIGTSRESGQEAPSRRTIARRGTEVFVAVGNEVRWSDLVALKEKGQALDEDGRGGKRRGVSVSPAEDDAFEGAYRVLKHTAYGNITQLVVAPREDYLVIVTSHTVHVVTLPHSSHLDSEDTGPIKVKCSQIGPTDHVLEGSPLAAVLWHPLGHGGTCLVTVTASAIVRLWELNRADRRSFDTPSLAVDLKRLANATSMDDVVRQTTFRESIGYSPDSVEMEVVSAAFSSAATGWASMTLWVAMKEGDIYALCPLLPPKKWQATADQLKCLTTAITAKNDDNDTPEPSEEENRINQMQLEWFTELCDQEYTVEFGGGTDPTPALVFTCPAFPGPIPKLQGPFLLEPEPEDSSDVTDLLVLGLRAPVSALERDYASGRAPECLPASVVCLATAAGTIHIGLDLDGVEGQWLSSEQTQPLSLVPGSELPHLVLLESIPLPGMLEGHPSRPTFTQDVVSPYTVFVTHAGGVCSFHLDTWVRKLATELGNSGEEGAGLRFDVMLDRDKTAVYSPIRIGDEQPDLLDYHRSAAAPPATCVVLEDSDLDYFVLTECHGHPFAATLDIPPSTSSGAAVIFDEQYEADERALVAPAEPRPAYRASEAFAAPSALRAFLDTIPARYRRTCQDEIRFSALTLEIMTQAHLILSRDTHTLALAAADLYRRCERLRDEFQDQVRRTQELSDRVDQVTGWEEIDSDAEGDDEEFLPGKAKLDQRLTNARERQHELVHRYENLWKKLAGSDTRDLSDRERAWSDEVHKMERAIVDIGDEKGDESSEDAAVPPWRRVEDATRLKEKLVTEAAAAMKEGEARADAAVAVPAEFRKAKVARVIGLLERESALVEATTARLSRLVLEAR